MTDETMREGLGPDNVIAHLLSMADGDDYRHTEVSEVCIAAAAALKKVAEERDMLHDRSLRYVAERNEAMNLNAKNIRRAFIAEAEASALRKERDALREALTLFRDMGCPVCGGDCASANPPVVMCPMQVARAALSRDADESGEAGDD